MAILTGNTSSNYSVTWLEGHDVGCTGQNAMTSADKYVAYVAQDGIRFSDLSQSVLATERLLPDWDNLNHRRLNQATLVYWKHYLLVSLPSKASLWNDQVWVFDFIRNAWTIYKGWNVSGWTKFSQYGEEVLLACDSITGQVYEAWSGSTEIDGSSIEYDWVSKTFDFGYPERYKLFRSIYLDISGTAEETNLTVIMYVDGVPTTVDGTHYKVTIPEGEGVKHTRRILCPLYGAILGRNLTIELKGRCGIQGISIEYIVRGNVPSLEY
jgi:hypothetical protein